MTDIQKNVEAASERYAASFTKGDLALPPARKYLVVTCMDARIDPAQAFGIELGDAHVVRNVSLSIYTEYATVKNWGLTEALGRPARRRSRRSGPSSSASSCWAPTRLCWSSIRGAACSRSAMRMRTASLRRISGLLPPSSRVVKNGADN